ncbi:MAG: PilW family protein [Bacillota bacterium]
MRKRQAGFTLLEICCSIMLISVFLISVYDLYLYSSGFWENMSRQINLRQQARVISMFLESDLRKARDVKILSGQKLYINLGSGYFNDPDQNYDLETDYYLQYMVEDEILKMKKTKSSFGNSGCHYPQWPKDKHLGNNNPLTVEIINDYKFEIVGQDILYYYFELENKGENYVLENNINLQ